MPYLFQKGELAKYNGPGLDEATEDQRLRAARSVLLRKFFSPSLSPLNARNAVYFWLFFLLLL